MSGGIAGAGGVGTALARLAARLCNIRFNPVSPGLIRTGFAASALGDPNYLARRGPQTPFATREKPDGIAAVAVVPATSGCRFRQRQNVIVDGGATISDCSKSFRGCEPSRRIKGSWK